MKVKACLMALASLVALVATAGKEKVKTVESAFSLAAGDDVLRVSVKPVANRGFSLAVVREGAKDPAKISVGYPQRGWNSGGKLVDWEKDISWSAYCAMQRQKKPLPKANKYEKAIVEVSGSGWFGFEYSLLPYFSPFVGLYRHDRVAKDIDEWLKTYPLYPDHVFEFEFRYDAARDRLEAYLDGSYAGRAPGSGALKRVVVKSDPAAVVDGKSFLRGASAVEKLSPMRGRAHDLLKEGAKLVFDRKFESRVRAAVDVWSPSLSIDQGRHRSNHPVRELTSDPESKRTPWKNGPEYMQWTVPTAFYRAATVLCADIPEKGKAPVVGLSMTRFGTASVGSADQEFLSLADEKAKSKIWTVGSLVYFKTDEKGKRQKVTTPLYLVRVNLNPFKILQYVNDLKVYGKNGNGRLGRMLAGVGDYLDLEFVGAGTWDSKPRSSVQVFGCTLEKMDYSIVMDQSVRGNLFERGTDKPETGVKVTAERDNAAGSVRWTIYDPLCRELAHGEQPFSIAKKGETVRLSFDLERPDVGWYGVDFAFFDAKGRELGVHEASYTILAADDREAGCESPYAAWPLGGGYHNSDPDRRQQAEVMRKAGYRISWQPPATNENEFGFAMTKSSLGQAPSGSGQHFYNPCGKRSAAELEKWLDKAVAHFKAELAKYPSCRYIQLLHEQGGRDIDACLYDPSKACVRGEYKGIDGDWDVYYCTEYAKRMRKEFPNLKIYIGNGSVSSQKIADLVRRGFDLSLVDQLGIESKGFSTMPELPYHRESPGCLWALGETGRYFGYSNLTLNACNEYVFRPERRVNRKGSPGSIMKMTNYAVRDYLLSLAHGCGIISSGHLEDCNDQYYDTNWGCGGQCTFYPFSYPKRMYTAISVFTRVMDKATYRRSVPTGAHAAYVLEFARDRKVKDYAYALWTQTRSDSVDFVFPKDANVRSVSAFGVERPVGKTSFSSAISATPSYLVSDKPVVSAAYRTKVPKLDKRYKLLVKPEMASLRASRPGKLEWGLFTTSYGSPEMPCGEWKIYETEDPEVGKVIQMDLVRKEPAPSPLLWEAGQLAFKKPITVECGEGKPRLAALVRGNGTGQIALGYRSPEVRGPSYCFGKTAGVDGWQLVTLTPPTRHLNKPITKVEVGALMFGMGRKALDPVHMVDVTEPLQFGGLYLVDAPTEQDTVSDADRRGQSVMKRDVSDKDL